MRVTISIGPHEWVVIVDDHRPQHETRSQGMRHVRRASADEVELAMQLLWLNRACVDEGDIELRTHSPRGVEWSIQRGLSKDTNGRWIYTVAAISATGEADTCPRGWNPGRWIRYRLGWLEHDGLHDLI
jgi:hypothetical protein